MPDSKQNLIFQSFSVESITGGQLSPKPQNNVITFAPKGPTGHLREDDQVAEPARLYSTFSPESGQLEADVPVAQISDAFRKSLEHLRSAAAESSEIDRENYVSLGWSNVLSLIRFIGSWAPFDDAMSLLLTAYKSHQLDPYQTPELVALQRVFEMLRRNPLPTQDGMNTIYDSLEKHFDLNAPLAGTDLYERSSG